jgi:hypothetical protein
MALDRTEQMGAIPPLPPLGPGKTPGREPERRDQNKARSAARRAAPPPTGPLPPDAPGARLDVRG